MTQNITPFKPLSKQDVAEAIGCSVRQVEIFVSLGELPRPVSIGRRVLWHPEIFYKWLDATLRAASPEDAELPLKKTSLPETAFGANPGRRTTNSTSASIVRMRAKAAALARI
jgi:predicted DNA-binding transcriptional regulator AlpA